VRLSRATVREDFLYELKAAFGRGRLRAGSLRSPVLAGQHHDDQRQELTDKRAYAVGCQRA
jgi:hypothetical protein